MANVRNRDLLAYSFVSQGPHGVNDRLSGILPFFLPIIKDMQGHLFDVEKFVSECNTRYPFKINEDICQELLPRFRNAGWLKEIRHDSSVSYAVLSIRDYAEDETRLQDAQSSLEEIGVEFHALLSVISPLQAHAYTQDELQELLLGWLVDKRAFEKSAILAALETEQPTRRSGRPTSTRTPDNGGTGPKREEDYLCARFVEYISSNNHPLFEKLVSIAEIAFVVEVALDIYRPYSEAVDLRTVQVFYDGPLVMDLLELSGRERHENASYIHDKLKRFKAQSYVFPHSCDEIRDNLKAVLHAHPGERFGPTAEAIKKGEVWEDYARAVLNDVEGNLERIGLTIREFELQSYPNTHRYFDGEQILDLKARLPGNEQATERDAMSVAFVIRAREGKSSPVLDRNRAVMVSSNIVLADTARRFCVERQLIRGNQVGPVMHRRQLATMLWLTLGSDEQRELTRRELLHRCADVVRLNPHVVRSARNTLATYDREKAAQFEALMSTPRASQMVMDLTLGVPEVVSGANIDEILDRIRRTAVEDVQEEYQGKMKALAATHRDRMARMKEQHSREVSKLEESTAEVREQLRDRDETLRDVDVRLRELEREQSQKDQAVCSNLLDSVERYEGRLRRKARMVASLVVVLVGIGSAGTTLGLSLPVPLGVVLGVGVFFAALVTAIQVFDRWMSPLENWVFRRKLKALKDGLERIGRTDLFDQFTVDHPRRRVAVRKAGD